MAARSVRRVSAAFAALALFALAAPSAGASTPPPPRPHDGFVSGKSCEAAFVEARQCRMVNGRRACEMVRRFVGYVCVDSKA